MNEFDISLDDLDMLDNFILKEEEGCTFESIPSLIHKEKKDEEINIMEEVKDVSKPILDVREVNGKPSLVLIIDNKVEVINSTDIALEKLYHKENYNNNFNKDKTLTDKHCDLCGKRLQRRTVDFIERHMHKTEGTKHEGKYYCYTCQRKHLNSTVY